jgi:hypothetical protein
MKTLYKKGQKVMTPEGMEFLLKGLLLELAKGNLSIELKEHEHIDGDKEISVIEITQNLKD